MARIIALLLACAPLTVSPALTLHDTEIPGFRCTERTGVTVVHVNGQIQRNVCGRWEWVR